MARRMFFHHTSLKCQRIELEEEWQLLLQLHLYHLLQLQETRINYNSRPDYLLVKVVIEELNLQIPRHLSFSLLEAILLHQAIHPLHTMQVKVLDVLLLTATIITTVIIVMETDILWKLQLRIPVVHLTRLDEKVSMCVTRQSKQRRLLLSQRTIATKILSFVTITTQACHHDILYVSDSSFRSRLR